MTKKVFLGIIAVFFLIILIFGFSFLFYLKAQMKSAAISENEISVRLEVPLGTSVREIAVELENQKLIKDSQIFYLAVCYLKASHKFLGGKKDFSLKSGSYNLKNSMTMEEIMAILQTGHQADIAVVIPEGLTLSKIATTIESHGICGSDDFVQSVKNKEIIADYGFSDSEVESLDGFLFPDTYFFVANMSGENVVRMMVDNFFAHIAKIAGFSGISRNELYKKVILASIVEREYRVADEAPLIASVFLNRIEKNIRLQSCATVEYIITEIEGLPHPDVILYKDLWRESPYNTYRVKGLPPSPISNPGFVALKAAAEPASTHYFYFRLTDENAGRHTFSETFDEHAKVNISYTKKAANK